MMIAWLVVLAVLLYVFRALSRPKVQDEDQTTGTPAGDNSGAASIVVGTDLAKDGVTAARKPAESEIEPFPMTPTKEDGLQKEPQTPSAVGWRPDSPAPSESALSADIGPVGPRTLSIQSSPSGSHMVDAAGLTPMTPRSNGDALAFGEDGSAVAASDAGSSGHGEEQGPKTPPKKMLSGMSFKLKMGRTQSDAERQAKAQAKQAAEAERVARIQQKEAAAEARSAQRLAAAQALLAQKEAQRQEAEMQRQAVLTQLAQHEKHRQAMRDAQAAVDRASNSSALMDQVARQQAVRQRMQEQAAARAYANSSAKA